MPQLSKQSRSIRSGQMTAVMRAAAVAGPKVLRVGVVRDGRVIEERILTQREHVTVGPAEKSTFVVSSSAVGTKFRLFERVEDRYVLNVLDTMSGRLALAEGVLELSQLASSGQRNSPGFYQVELDDNARGKVVVGPLTFLFQFVHPPPSQPRPQLPIAVYRGASAVDWRVTIVASFAFLVHFLAIGALYSDWLDPVVDRDLQVAGLVQTVKSLPAPPPIEDEPAEADQPLARVLPKENPATKPTRQPRSQGTRGKMTAREVAALSGELERLQMATLGALAHGGPATAEVLRHGDVPMAALDQAASSAAGVGIASPRVAGGGGPIRPGRSGELAETGNAGRARGTEGAGALQGPKGPEGSAVTGETSTAGGSVGNAAAVVAAMRPGFRRCYNQALQDHPDARGSIKLTIRVGGAGEVLSVSAAPSGGVPAGLASCVQARARAAQFSPPEGGAAVVQVPVTFVQQ